jgi:transcriptional regulator of acetoin/glycerol metabolism
MEKMVRYKWPGNVRELRNAIEYAFVLCPSGGIGVGHLPPKVVDSAPECPAAGSLHHGADGDEKAALIKALRQTSGNQSETARLLGVSRITIWKRIKKHGIDLKKEIYA